MTEMNKPAQPPTFNTHIYAVVRVKVLGTSFSQDPSVVADKVADAVSARPNQWFAPVHGSVDVDGASYDIEQVEFAHDVSAVLVDELSPDGDVNDVKEHYFDQHRESMTDYLALKAENSALKDRVAALEAQMNDSFLKPGVEPGHYISIAERSVSIDFPGGINAHLVQTDEGVLVDLGSIGASESSVGTSLHYNEAEGQICSEHDIDINDVSEWVGQHYRVNFETDTSAGRRAWIDRYIEAHELDANKNADAPSE